MKSSKKLVLKWVEEEAVKSESGDAQKKADAHTVSVKGVGVFMADGGSPLDGEVIDPEMSFDEYCELKFPDVKRG